MNTTYSGLNKDSHGITQLGRIVLDARVFSIIADTEDCIGWDMGRMQPLMDKVSEQWDKYSNLPSRLPQDLQRRHSEIYAAAMARARNSGWNPELADDD